MSTAVTAALQIAAAPSAGGAPIGQLIGLGAVYWGGTAAVAWLVYAHRTGRTRVLARAAAAAEWVFRVPGWAALPVAVATVGLLASMWGGVWDIGYHIDKGRDSGPLGNPAHWPLLLGFYATFAGGMLSLGLADQADATRAWVRLRRNWHAPIGGVLLTVCMLFAMAGLSLDDGWHRIFGQDVTLWSPTHFIFLFGGILTVIGMLVLLKEGALAQRRRRGARPSGVVASGWRRIQRAALLGGLLCGIELFLTEYDYGVPLYRQVWQPLLLAGAAGFIFTAARAWVGRGGALGAWLVYAVVRGTGILVPVIAGVSPSSMPLLVVEAASVELLALALAPRGRPLAFGAAAGALCGTVGFAAEYGWSQIAMPLPWTSALLPEGVIVATVAGVAGGLLGALFATALRGELPAPRPARIACVGAFALLIAACADAAVKHVPDVRAHVTLTDVRPAPHREALATVRLEPRNAADHANWLYVLAWQGRAPRVVDRLTRVGEGVYRSTKPIPLYGSWKVGLRLNRGYARGSVPVRLPVDRGLPNAEQHIPAVVTKEQLARAMRRSSGAALPAPAAFTRPFGDDGLIVLRETKGDVAGWVWGLAMAVTVLIWSAFIVALTFGLGRLARRGDEPLAAPGARATRVAAR
jgi:hypothetical protein